jgi:hypothetical protein
MSDALIKKLKKAAAARGAELGEAADETRLPPPATKSQVGAEERLMGQAFHPLHRRVLLEVANGGFGPAYGLFGVPPRLAAASRDWSLADLRRGLLTAEEAKAPIVPLMEWGSGTWAFCDVPSGDVLSLSDAGIVRTGLSLEKWLEAWCRKEPLGERVFVYREQAVINPFTKEQQVVRVACGLAGTPYVPGKG